MRIRALALFLATISTACGPAEDGPDAGRTDGGSTDAPRVELGTGTANFEPIGPTLELVAGPQGGWHLNVTCRLYEVSVEAITLTYRIERSGMMVNMPLELVLDERRFVSEGDHLLRAGDFIVFDITMPSDIVGSTVTVSVTAAPTDGEPVSDERTVMVVDEIP